VPELARLVPLLEKGVAALDEIDSEMGLAFDAWDKKYYFDLFVCAPLAPVVPAAAHSAW
jgi:hypothetical protein